MIIHRQTRHDGLVVHVPDLQAGDAGSSLGSYITIKVFNYRCPSKPSHSSLGVDKVEPALAGVNILGAAKVYRDGMWPDRLR
jgi:hypothetical protein